MRIYFQTFQKMEKDEVRFNLKKLLMVTYQQNYLINVIIFNFQSSTLLTDVAI